MHRAALDHLRHAGRTARQRLGRLRRRHVAGLTVLAVAAGGALSLAAPGGAPAADVQAAQVGQVRPLSGEAIRGAAADGRPDAAITAQQTAMVDAVTAQAHRALVANRREAAQARREAEQRAEKRAQRDAMWNRLADCESGDWNANSQPIPGTRRWDYGRTFSHGDRFEGGVNFDPPTWRAYKDADMPYHAYDATRGQQIQVAERVLADQGWKAWPVCSVKLGYR